MANRRIARLNEQFKREISRIVREEVRDPRVGLPTVTDVEVTPDLWLARVYVRPDPTHEEGKEEALLHGLSAATPFIRRELGRLLDLRRIPELRFEPDRTLDHALRIERILKEVRPEEGDEGGPDGADEPGPGEGGPPGETGSR